jgi:biotin transport system substrate-specific component
MNNTIKKLVFTALFAAIISAGAFIAVPIGPVPIVLQNLFTLLAGLLLGPFLGAASVALFLAAGAVGMPVFSGGSSGLARMMGPTGGYMLGYLLGAFAAGLIAGPAERDDAAGKGKTYFRLALAVSAGVLIVYIPGLIHLKMFLNTSWAQTFAAGFFPFILGDIAKGVCAFLVAPRLRRIQKIIYD